LDAPSLKDVEDAPVLVLVNGGFERKLACCVVGCLEDRFTKVVNTYAVLICDQLCLRLNLMMKLTFHGSVEDQLFQKLGNVLGTRHTSWVPVLEPSRLLATEITRSHR
jgi:hypothetical protein